MPVGPLASQGRPSSTQVVEAIAAKQLIAPALNTLVGDPKKRFASCYAQVQAALNALVKRAVESGEVRGDVAPMDLLHALVGFSHVADSPDWKQSAKRLVDILIAGARPGK